MTTRIIDGPCPVCNADKGAIEKIIPNPDTHPEVFYYQCIVCGYEESQQAKFPSHEE